MSIRAGLHSVIYATRKQYMNAAGFEIIWSHIHIHSLFVVVSVKNPCSGSQAYTFSITSYPKHKDIALLEAIHYRFSNDGKDLVHVLARAVAHLSLFQPVDSVSNPTIHDNNWLDVNQGMYKSISILRKSVIKHSVVDRVSLNTLVNGKMSFGK